MCAVVVKYPVIWLYRKYDCTLTFTMEHSLHALRPRKSFGTESIDMAVAGCRASECRFLDTILLLTFVYLGETRFTVGRSLYIYNARVIKARAPQVCTFFLRN